MTAIDLRSEITKLVQHEQNVSILEAIRLLLKRQEPESEFDLTDEELAELEEIDRRRREGLDTYYTAEEAMRMIREGRKA